MTNLLDENLRYEKVEKIGCIFRKLIEQRDVNEVTS